MTILIDEKKSTTDSYFYKVPCITSTFTAEILFVNGELYDVVSNFDRVPIRERLELYAALDEKITELEKGYSEDNEAHHDYYESLPLVKDGIAYDKDGKEIEGVPIFTDEIIQQIIENGDKVAAESLANAVHNAHAESIGRAFIEHDEDDELTEVLVGIQDNLENPYMDEYHYEENIKIEYIEFINKKGKCIRKQRKIYEAGTDNILAILDGVMKDEKPGVPTMQSFVDRFREECANCDIHFFGDSKGGSIWNDKHGCVSWHPEKGETIDQAIEEMKGKIDDI